MHCPQIQALTLCDAHVHIYDCFDLDTFLHSAWKNFRIAATSAGAQTYSAILMLSETQEDHWFSKLSEAAASGDTLGTTWSFTKTAETDSVRAHCDTAGTLFILAGRQIVSYENLEILALATSYEQPDGAHAKAVIEAAAEAGSLVVAPWGVGKWWGARGRLLSDLLQNFPADILLLGDNSGRPWFMGTPRHFVSARTQGRWILPGSDPLPFAKETQRPGSVGFCIEHPLDTEQPAADIKKQLQNAQVGIKTYMHCERFFPFFRNQIGMQLRKRFS
ncbi:hypothetical protein N9985_03045 [Gammaproteobacteria bacterium]|nr:hypothetical protein [Gammaproteobacteria bacterium]